MLQSLAGGTGSGLGVLCLDLNEFIVLYSSLSYRALIFSGAYLSESIRDNFGDRTVLLNSVVWPFESGEVTLQHYNALLTLATLTQVTTSTLLACEYYGRL